MPLSRSHHQRDTVNVGEEVDTGNPIERIGGLATPLLINVLSRHPRTGAGANRVSRRMHELDNRLRHHPGRHERMSERR